MGTDLSEFVYSLGHILSAIVTDKEKARSIINSELNNWRIIGEIIYATNTHSDNHVS